MLPWLTEETRASSGWRDSGLVVAGSKPQRPVPQSGAALGWDLRACSWQGRAVGFSAFTGASCQSVLSLQAGRGDHLKSCISPEGL